ncbi:O-methyltransferase [Cellulomonas sp.]|uniref:O-methyltransferase n=1 Tax=Cellulomonas sp. TaxID=40001 RepID=UPI00258D250E|nr:O-methyltransferase [Cellulomonas sp.]MCR6690076.1 O-methyltransferase [Cellulomonas sp.]
MSTQEIWTKVDDYVAVLAPEDEHLVAARRRSSDAGMPDIAVSAPQGALLHTLAALLGARRILEIGTLGGYSTLWLARALPEDGALMTLEISPEHASVARTSLDAAGVGDRVEIVVGDARTSLEALLAAGVEPFDLVFIDADKQSLALYTDLSMRLGRPGTAIVLDNVVRDGAVAVPDHPDDRVRGVQEALAAAAADPRLQGTVIQTVGGKGYDGFALLRVVG